MLASREEELFSSRRETESLNIELRRVTGELRNVESIYSSQFSDEEEKLKKFEALSTELDRLSSENRLLQRRVEEANRTNQATEDRAAEVRNYNEIAIDCTYVVFIFT